MQAGSEPIEDDELLYRRIPTVWQSESGISDQAFAPHKTEDPTGLSVTRAKYKSLHEAANGRPGKSYYVAVLQAGDLRENGVEVVPRPLPDDPGHAELPALNSADRKNDEVLKFQKVLVNVVLRIEGPFESPGDAL